MMGYCYWMGILVLASSLSLRANDLEHFFNSYGSDMNVSEPHFFQDQAAGHYTGGGVYMNQKNKTVQPLQVSLPHMNMNGCGGINMYVGAISFVKGRELRELGKTAAQGLPIYAFQLGLKSRAPQLENTIMSTIDKALAMARSMLNSCQMTQQIVGGLWPKNTAASEKICQDQEQSGNEDSYAARKHCAKQENREEAISKIKAKNADLLEGEYNLVWQVIQKMPEYKDNEELATFVLNLVGTVISRKEQGVYRVYRIPGKGASLKFLTTYLKGGNTSFLKCDELGKCLRPSLYEKRIPKGLAERTFDTINEIQVAYLANTALTDKQISFLNDAVNLPIYKYIQVSAASGIHFLTRDAIEYMSVSMLLYQFDKIISEVLDIAEELKKVQVNDALIQEFTASLIMVRRNIQDLFTSSTQNAKWKLDEAIKNVEKTIITRNP